MRRATALGLRLADGSSLSYSKLDPTARARLVEVDDDGRGVGPLALWLGDDASPLSPAAWQSVFRRANVRCAEVGLELRCSPHTLRHVLSA